MSPGGSVHDAQVDKLESQADEVLPLPQLQPLLAPHHRPLGRGRRLVPSQPDLRCVSAPLKHRLSLGCRRQAGHCHRQGWCRSARGNCLGAAAS